jgi:branched-chain amino acid transport system permease protein
LGKYDGHAGLEELVGRQPGYRAGTPVFRLDLGDLVLAGAAALLNLLDSRTWARHPVAARVRRMMAEAMGINTLPLQSRHFPDRALFASIHRAGWLLAHFQRTVNPSPSA